MSGDLDDLESTASGTVTVPLKSQSFGDRMRDFAMHRHIQVKKWPEAQLVIKRVVVASRDPWSVTVEGALHYQGRTTDLAIDATGSVSPQSLDATATFALDLPTIGIQPPSLLFLKVERSVDVIVRIVAKGSA
jgi:polyisoprenoid-binding protein YceI